MDKNKFRFSFLPKLDASIKYLIWGIYCNKGYEVLVNGDRSYLSRGTYNRKDSSININLSAIQFSIGSYSDIIMNIISTINHEYTHKAISSKYHTEGEEVIVSMLTSKL